MKDRIPRKLKKRLIKAGWEPVAYEGRVHLDSRGGAPVTPRRYWDERVWSGWRRRNTCW